MVEKHVYDLILQMSFGDGNGSRRVAYFTPLGFCFEADFSQTPMRRFCHLQEMTDYR